VQEAVDLGLQNSLQIKVTQNQTQIASNRNTAGNAGFLPRASVAGSVNSSINNTRQSFLNGEENNRAGASNTSARVGAEVSWTAFDGFQMFATRDRLDLEEQRTRSFTERARQELAADIQTAYYGLVRLRQQIANTEQSIELNVALQELAQNKLRIGTGTRLEVLQTTNRVNADSSQLLNLQDQFAQARISFNRLLNRDAQTGFDVPAQIPDVVLPTREQLTDRAIQQNYDLQLLNFDERIALTQIREARAALYPSLDLFASYDYNFSRSEAGFLLSNRSFGPTAGVSASYDIFAGRSIKKEVQNAELIKDNIRLNKEDLIQQIRADVATLYQQYQALQELLVIETRNVETAEQNTALAQRLYQSGRATNFDVREAILQETLVKDRLSDVQLRKKLTEIELKNLAGIRLY